MLVKQAESGRRNGTVFTFFIQEFRSVMVNPAASSKDVSTAIRGYGYFAAVSTFSTNVLCLNGVHEHYYSHMN